MNLQTAARRISRIPFKLFRKSNPRQALEFARYLYRESGITDPGFADEIRFWTLELALCGEYPRHILDRTTPKRMIRVFPKYRLPLFEETQRHKKERIRVLDVGSGPVSIFCFGEMKGMLSLLAIDPLADVYKRVLSEYGYNCYHALEAISGETISERLDRESFDFVWSSNALDHCQAPRKVFRGMVELLAPQGYLNVRVNSREGTVENFVGLHRHDIFLEGEKLMIQSLDPNTGKLAEAYSLSEGLPLNLAQVSTKRTPFGVRIDILWKKESGGI